MRSVLWAYQTIARTSTGEIPFKLSFGIKIVIPTNVRKEFFNKDNNKGLKVSLDCLDKIRDEVLQRMKRYQQVKHKRFDLGELVLRKVSQATKDPTQGKLKPTWEGPYKIIQLSRSNGHEKTTLTMAC